MLVGATGVFVQLQKTLNIIWEVEAKPNKSGLLRLIRLRLFSFGMILSIAFVLLISLVISSFLAASGDWILRHWGSTMVWFFNVLNFYVLVCFYHLPFSRPCLRSFRMLISKWRYVWLGAFPHHLVVFDR